MIVSLYKSNMTNLLKTPRMNGGKALFYGACVGFGIESVGFDTNSCGQYVLRF